MDKILFNDKIIDREILIDIEDRGYQFGDGIYEVVGVYDKEPFLMDEHLERLQQSAEKIHMELPFSLENIKEKLGALAVKNEVVEGLIYIQVSRGVAPRKHELPTTEMSPVVVAYTQPLGDLSGVQDEGATAILSEDVRWLRCDIKSLNLLPNTMAKQQAAENDSIEAILHRGDTVTEASASNVFIVKSGELFTHPANNYILNGITRQQVIMLCDKLNIKINEKAFTVDELLQADEVFITATKLDVVGITKIDDQEIGEGVPGELTLKLLHQFRILTKSVTVDG